MRQFYIPRLNELIREQSSQMEYTVADRAPSVETELFGNSGRMVIWAGESQHTIYGAPEVNWGFRAIHDQLHLDTNIGFDPLAEIHLARLQIASMRLEGTIADLVYAEIAGQAEYYQKTGNFVTDQLEFNLHHSGIDSIAS